MFLPANRFKRYKFKKGGKRILTTMGMSNIPGYFPEKVIPAKAGIHNVIIIIMRQMDTRLRGYDS